MDNVELVCIVCKKEQRGSGAWAYHDVPSTWEQEDGLCPDCRQELFSEFGQDDRRPMISSLKIGDIVRFVFSQFRFGANATH